ncbi:MAG: CotH kinase family protein [Crocinitomicaceae bacterium]|nr:CotH kinase family protein [Crocinitomicaceae bacterium]
MKTITSLLFLITAGFGHSQVLYDPQVLYDAPGGLMDPTILRTMDITFYNANYDNVLDAGWNANTGLRLPATVQLDGGALLPNVMVRYKGNSTYAIPSDQGNPKVPYNLDFNDSVTGQTLLGYNKVKLANAMFDPTFVKEMIAYDIYRRYLPTPEANLMELNVQGNYLGLYVNTETIDRKFLKKHFDESKGPLFKCDPIQQFGQTGPTGNSDLEWLGTDTSLYYNHYSMKSTEGWEEFVNLINILNNSPNDLNTVLNIDRVLWAFAVNQAILNLDVYNGLYQHNYYMYQTKDGLFQMIPWDASESFLGALLGANANTTALYQYDPYNGYNSWWYPLSQALTSDPNSFYGKIYTAHLRTVVNESLDASAIANYANTVQALGAPSASADGNKFFGMTEYYSNVTSELVIPFIFSAGGIVSSVDLRKPYLESLVPMQEVPPTISTPIVLPPAGAGTNYVTAQVSNATSVELMATKSQYNSKFISIPMYDDGTNGDATSGDGNYTGAFPWWFGGNTAKFYIRANNANATMLNPERAEYEFYTYDLPLAVEDLESFVVEIYPNPSSGIVNVSTPSGSNLKFTVKNSVGQLIMKSELKGKKIDLANQQAGIYFISFEDNQGRTAIKKLVIQ